jgi:glycosyltransferase involved in cell wall biosynthesis
MAPARVLVVSHEARRTGAPKVALEIQRSLHGEDATEVVSLLRGGGALAGEFAATSDRLRREPLARVRAVLRRPRRLRRRVDQLDELIAWSMLRRSRPTVVYLNTVKSACYVRPALRLGIPTILHVHELGVLASSTLRRYEVGDRWKDVRLVACSTACRDGLAEQVHVPVAHIDVVHSPVDTDDVERRGAHEPVVPSPTPALVVGACGVVNERKGADLWVEVAAAVRAERPDLAVRFQWVGRQPGEWPVDAARERGVDDVIEWVGEVAEPYPLIAASDVFTLPSREDPFPLVVLEAMALARPIVAFDVGGVHEQLDETGVVVDAEDVAAMAAAVIALLDDDAERRRLGALAAERVRSLYDVGPFRDHIKRIVEAAAAGLAPSASGAPSTASTVDLTDTTTVDLTTPDADRPTPTPT